MFEQDYVMRQIQAMAAAMAYFLLKKNLYRIENAETPSFAAETNFSGGGELPSRIRKLLEEKKFCEAENLLFDTMRPGDKDVLETALNFYRALNERDEEELKAHGFSHDEIKTGLRDIAKLYGADLEGLFEA